MHRYSWSLYHPVFLYTLYSSPELLQYIRICLYLTVMCTSTLSMCLHCLCVYTVYASTLSILSMCLFCLCVYTVYVSILSMCLYCLYCLCVRTVCVSILSMCLYYMYVLCRVILLKHGEQRNSECFRVGLFGNLLL